MAEEYLRSVQQTLGYQFQDEARLSRCFRAAHRSDLDGTEDDGNRSLARFGVTIMEAVELQCSLDVGRGARYVADLRTSWVKSKEKRAEACDMIGFSQYIVVSIRQSDGLPTKTTRALVISAIIAAVFEDLWAQEQAVNVVWAQLATILDRIGARANGNLPVNPSDLIQNRSASSNFSGVQPTRGQGETSPEMPRSLQSMPTTDVGTPVPDANGVPDTHLETEYDFLFDPDIHSDQTQVDWDWLGISMDDPSAVDNVSSLSEGFFSQNHLASSIVGPCVVDHASSVTSVGPEPSNAVSRRQPKVFDDNEELRIQHVQAELTKATCSSDIQRLYPLLEHDGIASSVPAPYDKPIRLLYFFVGSPHSVAAFRRALLDLRSRAQDVSVRRGEPMSTLAHLQMVDRLHQHSAANSMLVRWHILKAFEDDLPQAASAFVNQTRDSFTTSQPEGAGNMRLKFTAALIDAKMKSIYPDLRPGSAMYKSRRTYLMRLFKIAKYLYAFTDRFGLPILAFLPYQDQRDIYFSDNLLVSMSMRPIQYCVDILQTHQGTYLRHLSGQIRHVVDSLIDGSFSSLPPCKLATVSEDTIMAASKGSAALMDCL